MNGAEAIITAAISSGIDVCFANPGTTEIPLVAALDACPGIRPVLGLFEGVCTGAADGYGRVADRPAMTLLHLGPGFANGIANLHNARRAGSPVVNLVGEHATWHRVNDPPLAMDLEGLVAAVSKWQRTSRSAQELARDMADAVSAARQGTISSLIVPHDLQQAEIVHGTAWPLRRPSFQPVDRAAILQAAAVLREHRPAALVIGGRALRKKGLLAAARIRAATGCVLLTSTFPAYVERGAGLPVVSRIPYFPEPAIELLSSYRSVVLAGVHEPVTFFGYPGLPGRLLNERQRKVVIGAEGEDMVEVIEGLADAVDAPPASGLTREALAPPFQPGIPNGELTPEKACLVLAALQPENAVIIDEGLTTAFSYLDASAGCPPHAWTAITGGAIGYGMPCAVGAALAAPGRKVINLQADGSALYTVQALWTEAREALDIVTLICSNRSYHIVEMELARSGITKPGKAAAALTTFDAPPVDWVNIASGFGVPACRVDTADGLALELRKALAEPGPRLIELLL